MPAIPDRLRQTSNPGHPLVFHRLHFLNVSRALEVQEALDPERLGDGQEIRRNWPTHIPVSLVNSILPIEYIGYVTPAPADIHQTGRITASDQHADLPSILAPHVSHDLCLHLVVSPCCQYITD